MALQLQHLLICKIKRLRSLSKAKQYLREEIEETSTTKEYVREEIETSTIRDYLRVDDTAAAMCTGLRNKRLRSLSKATEYLREEVEETSTTKEYLRVDSTAVECLRKEIRPKCNSLGIYEERSQT